MATVPKTQAAWGSPLDSVRSQLREGGGLPNTPMLSHPLSSILRYQGESSFLCEPFLTSAPPEDEVPLLFFTATHWTVPFLSPYPYHVQWFIQCLSLPQDF